MAKPKDVGGLELAEAGMDSATSKSTRKRGRHDAEFEDVELDSPSAKRAVSIYQPQCFSAGPTMQQYCVNMKNCGRVHQIIFLWLKNIQFQEFIS